MRDFVQRKEEEGQKDEEEDKKHQQLMPRQDPIKCKDTRTSVDDSAVCNVGSLPSAAQAKSTTEAGLDPDHVAEQAHLEKVKQEHRLAKAVKSDDVELPVHFWDKEICREVASEEVTKALATFREFFMCIYRRRLLKDAVQFLSDLYGRGHLGGDMLGWRRRAQLLNSDRLKGCSVKVITYL